MSPSRITKTMIPVPEDGSWPFMGMDLVNMPERIQPSMLASGRGVYIQDGVIGIRASYSVLADLPVANQGETVLGLCNFEDLDGSRTLIAFTQKRPFKYDSGSFTDLSPRYTIDGVNTGTKTFTIGGDGDLTTLISTTTPFEVSGSTGNDGTYTIASVNYSAPNFHIIVNETVPSAVADGQVKILWDGSGDFKYPSFDQGTQLDGRLLVATNGLNRPICWTGTGNFTLFAPDLPNFVTCNAVAFFKDQLWMMGLTTTDIEPTTVAYSVTANFDDFTSDGSGLALLSDMRGDIWVARPMAGRLVIYSSTGCVVVISFVGDGTTEFAYETMLQSSQILSPNSIVNRGDYHIFSTQNGVSVYDGSREVTPVDGRISKYLADQIDISNRKMGFSYWDVDQRKIGFYFPTISDDPMVGNFFSLDYSPTDASRVNWTSFKPSPDFFCAGDYQRDDSLRWDSDALSGLGWDDVAGAWVSFGDTNASTVIAIGAQGFVALLDGVSYSDARGADQEGLYKGFTTKRFTVPVSQAGDPYPTQLGRWLSVEIQARGTSVDVLGIGDDGVPFMVATQALTEDYASYRLSMDYRGLGMNLWFRVNAGGGDWYQLKWIRLWVSPSGIR